jgi:cell division septum initiation protein DivIVA
MIEPTDTIRTQAEDETPALRDRIESLEQQVSETVHAGSAAIQNTVESIHQSAESVAALEEQGNSDAGGQTQITPRFRGSIDPRGGRAFVRPDSAWRQITTAATTAVAGIIQEASSRLVPELMTYLSSCAGSVREKEASVRPQGTAPNW